MTCCINRLTAIGSKQQVKRFHSSRWATALGAKHCELLENSPTRFACQFETEAAPLESLRRLSRRWPRLILLLEYEVDEERIKGLAKAAAAKLEHYQIEY